ncbi:MAG: gamma-glutamylcyclotransferase family protein [Chloroflexota bacterium]|nr:gamma-glutamylcyclotransferase family protein [Chloroflexota bacterium]
MSSVSSDLQQMVWYFAYGSNLNKNQMRTRVGDWSACRKATLRNWELLFNVKSRKWGKFAANIRGAGTQDKVWGVVYQITKKQLDVLTKCEGVAPTPVAVETANGDEPAYAYVFNVSREAGRAPELYWQTIEQGLRQHEYDESVIDEVGRIAQSGQ